MQGTSFNRTTISTPKLTAAFVRSRELLQSLEIEARPIGNTCTSLTDYIEALNTPRPIEICEISNCSDMFDKKTTITVRNSPTSKMNVKRFPFFQPSNGLVNSSRFHCSPLCSFCLIGICISLYVVISPPGLSDVAAFFYE